MSLGRWERVLVWVAAGYTAFLLGFAGGLFFLLP